MYAALKKGTGVATCKPAFVDMRLADALISPSGDYARNSSFSIPKVMEIFRREPSPLTRASRRGYEKSRFWPISHFISEM